MTLFNCAAPKYTAVQHIAIHSSLIQYFPHSNNTGMRKDCMTKYSSVFEEELTQVWHRHRMSSVLGDHTLTSRMVVVDTIPSSAILNSYIKIDRRIQHNLTVVVQLFPMFYWRNNIFKWQFLWNMALEVKYVPLLRIVV